ncbi:hypothetical protein [Roseateles chitosanitabidus]|uniref:hypothetical protein n=1 Tax=Roseateles chitosanitabidus TaxID=65048 RepID=UPI00082F613E|nr:hypothetical protein [Roseateles chitosanitabidus]
MGAGTAVTSTRVRIQLADLADLRIASFDLVLVTPPASEVGLVIFHREGTVARRILQVEVPQAARAGARALIQRALDPDGGTPGWIFVAGSTRIPD